MLICSVTNTHEHSHTIIPTETHPSFGEPKTLHHHASFPSFCFRKHHVKTRENRATHASFKHQQLDRPTNATPGGLFCCSETKQTCLYFYPSVADHFRQNNKQQPNQSIEKIAPPVSVLILSNTKKKGS